MKVNMRTITAVQNLVNSLFYILTKTDSETLKGECQRMINVLYREFPGSIPQPQNEREHTMPKNKDTFEFDDNDGKLHLYICAALDGDRWAAQLVFDKDQRTTTYFKQQGEALISATAKSLLKQEIISA